MVDGGSLEGRTWCSSTRGRSRGTTDGGGSSCRSAGPSMRVLDVSGLDRVPLVDGDRADVSGRHAHAHTSTRAHEHDPPIRPRTKWV